MSYDSALRYDSTLGITPLDSALEEPDAETLTRRRMETWSKKGLGTYLHITEPAEKRRRWGFYSSIAAFYLFLVGAGIAGFSSKNHQGIAAAPLASLGILYGGVGAYSNKPAGFTRRREIAQGILESRMLNED